MKIFVCIKQVPDTETKLKLTSDSSAIDPQGIKWVLNPYDEFAVEEALKWKTPLNATVTVISVGPQKRVVESLRTAMAMGADDGIVIHTEEPLGPLATAQALASVIQTEGEFSYIFTGKQSIDLNQSSVPQMLAELLQIPHATVISKFETTDLQATVEREIEGGAKEVINLKGPAVVAATKGLNTPRYASLPGIMKAKKKPLKEVDFNSLNISESYVKYTHFELPKEKPPVKMLSGEATAQAKELCLLLREEAKVI